MPTGYVIAEAIILIAAIVAASAFSASVFTTLGDLGQAHREKIERLKKELSIDAEIIFATSTSGSSEVKAWVKNTGSSDIHPELVKLSDVFLGNRSMLISIPYQGTSLGWTYIAMNDVDNDGRWDPGETLLITITLNFTLSAGEYFVRFVAYLGQRSDYYFSI